MPKVGNGSIAKRLTWMNLLVSGVALLLACLGFVAYGLTTFRETLVQTLSTQAEIIGSNSVSAILFNDRQSAESTLSALAAAPQHPVRRHLYAGRATLRSLFSHTWS